MSCSSVSLMANKGPLRLPAFQQLKSHYIADMRDKDANIRPKALAWAVASSASSGQDETQLCAKAGLLQSIIAR